MNLLIQTDLKILDGMLGIDAWGDPDTWGLVNYCATDTRPNDYFAHRLSLLEAAGLVRRGAIRGEFQYWHATHKGIAYAGVPWAHRKRAFAAATEVAA